VPQDQRASAIAVMFTGLTVANVLGVPFGTWLGQHAGWRATFWAVSAVGVLALAVLAAFVPARAGATGPASLRADLDALMRRPVLLGFATTVLGFAGLFALFTYIAPLLTRISGFGDAAVSPILLVFGAGLVAGNLAGGKLADRHLPATVLGSLALLAGVLVLTGWALHSRAAAVVAVGLLGAASFATVAPLQMWVLEKAQGAGQSLASSFNIAAFNLGNALGAWLGGVVIAEGPGLASLAWVSALLPLGGLAIAAFAMLMERRPRPNVATA